MNLKANYLIMAVLLTAILFLGVITRNTTKLITDKTIEGHQQSIAAEAAKTVDLWLQQQMKIINATAEAVQQIPIKDNPPVLRFLKMAMEAGNFSDVYLGLTDGTMIDGAEWIPPAGYDPRVRPWYEKAMYDKTTAFTRPYLDMTTGKMVIAIVRPLWVRDTVKEMISEEQYGDGSGSQTENPPNLYGEVIRGVISGDVILNTLEENVLNLKIGQSGYAFIIDSNGTILIHPDHKKQMKEKIQDGDPSLIGIMNILGRTSLGSCNYEYQGEEKILSYQRLPDSGWYLCTTIRRDEAYTLAKHTAMLFAMGVVFKILGFLAVLTILFAICSGAVVLISKKRLESAIRRHNELISLKEKDLRGEIIRRKEVESRYWTLFNVATNAIILIRDEHCIECNQKAMELFELDHRHIMGKSILDISPETQQDGQESRVRFAEKRAQINQDPLFFEWIFMRSDRSEFPAEVSMQLIFLDSEAVTLCSIWDISRRTNAEQRLMQAQKMAAMGEMLSLIAHQWRQPLNVLSSYIASLTPAFYNKMITKEFIERVVAESDSQIQFMSRTINDFRDYFKPSKNKHPFDICGCAYSAAKLIQPQLKKSNIQFSIKRVDETAKADSIPSGATEISEEIPVFGYENEFIHVLINILSNARDAIEEKSAAMQSMPKDEIFSSGITEEREIELSIIKTDESVRISIEDTGCGIPDQFLSKIFTPYFTTKGTSTGTGIGLYMAKMIVEKEMKGSITVENHERGARFKIELPLS